MIKKLLNRQSHTITGAAIIIGAASFISRIIGMVRDRLFAHHFGAGDVMDAYYAAFKIPDLVYNLLIVGALSAGFIPIFVELLTKDKKQAWRVTNAVINILGILLVVTCGILMVFTPNLMHLLVPGFEGEKFEMTIMLTRIMFLSPILLGISSVISGVLQSFRAFLVYSLTPIMYNLGIILGITIFVPMFGVAGLAYGVILGALFHLLIQIPSLIQNGFKYQALFLWKDKYVRKIGALMIPRTLGMATRQINFLVITIIASTLASGSIAIFSFADNLQSVPSGIVGVSFGIAIFPTLARLAAKGNKKKMSKSISDTTRQILFLIIPLTIIFLLLRAQIVRIVLGTGEFDWNATILTANALAFFSISLFAQSLIPLLARSFYALQNTWTPFIIGLVSAGTNVIAAIYLSNIFGITGLVAGYSFSMILQMALLWIFLHLKLGTLHETKVIMTLLKISIAAFFMALSIQLLKYPIAQIVDMQKFWGILIQGGLSGTIGLLVYGFICNQLKLKEMRLFHESLKKRWLKLRNIQGEVNEADNI
ncbi:murein biosynthesis integral membrane protein MurJ [Candidatus Parcubacteria bacterium]|jgi:putative peptidoglycan lipid II flippase|nr:murein biosynthesis integral membrane protein MurJ [Candidatus Parcubacteria bacterium]MBT3948775.1 murein biosynthesis integral membrane protein MurJ [Candidatus Parcubacteria bacterium]